VHHTDGASAKYARRKLTVVGGFGDSLRQPSPSIKEYRSGYGYDLLNRLVAATSPDEAFQYDLLGNILYSPATQHNALNQLVTDGKFQYTYDLNGNQVTKRDVVTSELTEYSWSSDDELVRVVIKRDGANPVKAVDFKYNGLGRRVEKTVTDHLDSNKSYTKKFVYDGGNMIAEVDGQGNTLATYVHGPGVDQPIMMMRGGENYYYTRDGLGSVRDITGAGGKLKQRQRYSAYGITTVEKDERGQDYEFVDSPYAYTGRELDWETGLQFHHARYYDPRKGSWVSSDPIGFAGGDLNLYRYVGNSPTMYTDPSGLIWLNIASGVFSGVVSAALGGDATDIAISAGLGFIHPAGGLGYAIFGEAIGHLANPPSVGDGSDSPPKPLPQELQRLIEKANSSGQPNYLPQLDPTAGSPKFKTACGR